jgi:hypothetical protein
MRTLNRTCGKGKKAGCRSLKEKVVAGGCAKSQEKARRWRGASNLRGRRQGTR